LQEAQLVYTARDKSTFSYEIDYAAFEAAITPQTRVFILCQPHNPTGVEYTPEQLTRLAEICLRHDLLIISDEIHCDLMLGGTRHTPTAALAPEIAAHCLTLMAPSKTFNLPGLGCSFGIAPGAEMRKQLAKAAEGIVPHMNVLGLVAAEAAYRHGGKWLAELLVYLTANRDFLVRYVQENLPGIRTTVPQATYLAWLDCRELTIDDNPYKYFLDRAKVALNDGAAFGRGGEGFARVNFGCPRAQLAEALEKLHAALADG
jgi:cystathionine beta-lyase